MSKDESNRPHIVWQLSNDAIRPKEAPWGFVVQNPLARSIPPGKTMQINLNVASNYPYMRAWPVRSYQGILEVADIVSAGQEVVVTVRNASEYSPLVIETKESLVCLEPISFPGATTEVG